MKPATPPPVARPTEPAPKPAPRPAEAAGARAGDPAKARPAEPVEARQAGAGAANRSTRAGGGRPSGGEGGKSKQASWPIQPLPGEPPLTLFRHKRMVELPAGAEVDRFGQPDGNLTYLAGTLFEQRSLVPSWVNRPYRLYKLRRPLEVLTGVAVPWFDQPGGGTAYLLPKSIEDLLAEGALTELPADHPPVSG